jgi:hypothetical protein
MATTPTKGKSTRASDPGIKDNPAKETPKKWQGPKEIRGEKGSGKYPNYWSHKSRSGHNIIVDDSKGSESITIQHRSGAALQMLPNGAMHIVSHNGQYNIVFGEDRMTITGAQDITVKGDASLRVYGDYNVTVHGNTNFSMTGDFNVTSKGLNRHIRGNIDTQAKNKTTKLEGSGTTTAQGALSMVAEKAMTVASRGAQSFFGAAEGLNFATKKGDITGTITEEGNYKFAAKDGTFDVTGEKGINLLSNDTMSMIAKAAFSMLSKEGDVQTEASQGNINTRAAQGKLQGWGTEIHHNSQDPGAANPTEAKTGSGEAPEATKVAQEDQFTGGDKLA